MLDTHGIVASVTDDVSVLRRMAGLATPMTLRVAVTLGLPDRLLTEAATVDRLSSELAASPTALRLMLNHLVTLGVLEETTAGYRTTRFGANLSAYADNGFTHNLLNLNSAGGRAELAFVDLAHSVLTGQAAYTHRYGRDFYTDLAANPHLRESFDEQMNQRFADDLPRIAAGYDWARFPTIVDVGDGHGGMLAAILTAHPELRGHLLDLDPTATEAVRSFTAHGLTDRVRVTAGSFFDTLPPGADAYLLFDILHNWDDRHAHQILHRCVEAAQPTSRVLVIESLGDRRTATASDLAMLVIFGGRDRTEQEFRDLTAAHGLTLEKVTELTEQRCLIEFSLASPN